jgi:hypothetical protein
MTFNKPYPMAPDDDNLFSVYPQKNMQKRGAMNFIPIQQRINNLEIISILMNSVAAKFNCSVRWNSKGNSLEFIGDKCYQRTIIEETMGFFEH